MKKLALLLTALLALAVIVTAYAKNKIGFDICHKADSQQWILLEQMPIEAWLNGHSGHAGDFLADAQHPCPPQGNDNPGEPEVQVTATPTAIVGPPPVPTEPPHVDPGNPGRYLYMPFHSNNACKYWPGHCSPPPFGP